MYAGYRKNTANQPDSPLEKAYSKSSELLMRKQTYEWKGIYVMLESHKNIETNRE